MEPITDAALDGDRLILAELRREAQARGYAVITVRDEDLWLCVMYLAGILAGIWIAAVARG